MLIRISTVCMLVVSLFLYTSCEREEEKIGDENQILQAYPGVHGELIDFIINGDTITVEKINDEFVFQGDIILTEEQLKYSDTTKGSGVPLSKVCFRWPYGIVPYKIDATASHLKGKIKAAMDEIETYTSITFIEHTIQYNYITFVYDNGNSSHYGMLPYPQKIRLNSWASKGTAIHEICHALGMIHEFSRSDRDDWVIICWDNIDSLKYYNFDKIKCRYITYPFDFNSIMMYPSITSDRNFALDIEKPIITKKDSTSYDWNTSDLSQGDIEVINLMYSGDWIVAKPLVVTKIFDEKVEEATVGGIINFNGNAYITERGVLWRQSSSLESENKKIQVGQGEGSFSTILTGLTPNTYYVAQAYAINSAGTGFGEEAYFRTKPNPTLPEVNTNSDIKVTSTTAECGGVVLSDGFSEVTDRGIYYGKLQNPETSGIKVQIGTGSGSFSTMITGLTPSTTYYVKAYVTNSIGTAYGSQESFTTSSQTNDTPIFNPNLTYGSFTDPRDGTIYKTINIGPQIWMAQNLAYLPSIVGPGTGSYTTPYQYVYGYNVTSVSEAKATANYQTYGVLYNWPAAMSACPTGWHLPSEAEWIELINYLGGARVAGGKLKETDTTHWSSPNTGATNETGFTALPGGSRDNYNRTFYNIGNYGNWWSASEYDGRADCAWYHLMYYNYSDVSLYYSSFSNKGAGLSVRCVKD